MSMPSFLEHVANGVHVIRNGILDHQFAARDGRESDVGADFDVIAVDVKLAAVQ